MIFLTILAYALAPSLINCNPTSENFFQVSPVLTHCFSCMAGADTKKRSPQECVMENATLVQKIEELEILMRHSDKMLTDYLQMLGSQEIPTKQYLFGQEVSVIKRELARCKDELQKLPAKKKSVSCHGPQTEILMTPENTYQETVEMEWGTEKSFILK